MQKVHREPAAAAIVPVGGAVLSDSSQPSGSSGPGSETGVSPGDGSAPAGPPAFPPGPADPTLAGPGRPHAQALPSPGASPGAVRPRSSALPTGHSFLSFSVSVPAVQISQTFLISRAALENVLVYRTQWVELKIYEYLSENYFNHKLKTFAHISLWPLGS